MSIGTALTVIAVALAVVAILAILAVVILIRLLLHLVQMEKNLSHQIGQLSHQVQDVLSDWKAVSHRVSHTVEQIRFSTRGVKGLLSLLGMVKGAVSRQERKSPRLMDWARLGYSAYSLIQRRRRSHSQKPPPTAHSGGM